MEKVFNKGSYPHKEVVRNKKHKFFGTQAALAAQAALLQRAGREGYDFFQKIKTF